MAELNQDQIWMRRAIELARQGQYSTKPNPNVGCVIVKDGIVIGEGFHPQAASRMLKSLRCVRPVNRHVVQPLM